MIECLCYRQNKVKHKKYVGFMKSTVLFAFSAVVDVVVVSSVFFVIVVVKKGISHMSRERWAIRE